VILRQIRVADWRNIESLVLAPKPGVSVFFGENGQGKTNLIEAAYFLSEFRSFRTRDVADVIRWARPKARLEAVVEIGGLDRKVEVEIGGERKVTRVDGKAARRDASSLRGLAVVLFVPDDLLLPRAAPAARRMFLDRTIFGVDRTYYTEAVAYQRALKGRNAILRQNQVLDTALIEAYDEQMARLGARLVIRRRQVVAALNPRVESLFAAIHGPLQASIRYRGHDSLVEAVTEEQVVEALARGLFARRDLDIRRRFSGFGPHTDDVDLDLGGRPARDHASQGQVRSFVLALKLAELAFVEETLGEPPLLLLDDVASELDRERRQKLFETIAGLDGQTLITVTDPALLPPLPNRQDFAVAGGRFSPHPTSR
jgi:DNA replication and repair protein RecF